MKLKTTFFAAACALALSTSAATFTPGKQNWPPTSSYQGGSSGVLFDLLSQQSSSQNIYSSSQLTDLPHVVNADGSSTVSLISDVQLPFYMGSAYYLNGEATFTVYLTPYSETAFPLDGTEYQWIDYNAEGAVSGTATITSTDDDVFGAAYGEDMVVVNVHLDTPYEYSGGGFVLTVQCDNSMADDDYDYWFMGTYSYVASSHCSAIQKDGVEMSGRIASTSNVLPVVNFVYETKEIPAQSSEEVGEPAVFIVGNYDTCSSGTPSLPEGYLPVTGDHYDYSYTQVIYTSSELNNLNKVGEKITYADITDLTFKLSNEAAYDQFTGSFSGKVYIQNYDGVTFPILNNNPQWIEYDPTVEGSFETESYYYESPNVIEVKATFNKPLRYEGKSLLVTFVADCSDFSGLYDGSLEQCVFEAQGNQSAATASYNELGTQTGDAKNVTNLVPVIKLGYTPVTVTAAVKPVVFGDVTLSLHKVDVTSGLFFGITEANTISINFDLVNAEEDGKYDITLANEKVGTLTGTSGMINFVGYPKADLVLEVTPQAEGVVGGSHSISLKDDIEVLFPNPEVEATGETAAFAEYTAHVDRSATVEAVAKFKFKTNVPVANMKGSTSVQTIKAVTSSTNMPDCFDDFRPAGEYNDYAANDGYISYYCSNLVSATVDKGVFQNPSAQNLTVGFSMDYPVVYMTSPVLADAVPTEVTTKSGFESTTINREYDNGSGYSYSKSNVSARIDFDETALTLEINYPNKLTVVETEGYISFFAPEGHKIYYIFVADPDHQAENAPARVKALAEEAENWVEHDTNVYSHSTDVPGSLVVKNVDADGNDGDIMSYVIDSDGNTTGIENVSVDNAAAPAEYFDLNGRRVANPSTGIYIIRQGSNVSKVLVK